MTVAAWLKAIAMLITLLHNSVQAYRNWQERQRGRLEVLLELRRKRDQEKAKADAIRTEPVPSDDVTIIGGL